MGMKRVYPNPSEMRMRFDFSSLLDIDRVTGKYIRVWHGDREGKTRSHLPYCHT